MAIQRRVNWISQQRVDVPDVRSIESAVSNDFDQLIQAFVTGTSQGYVLRGFEISMTGAIGGAASGLMMVVDPGALMHIGASQSGTIFMVPTGTPHQQLNSAINTAVTGAFTPNALNYVGIDYTRYIDPTTDAQVYIWDPTTKSETTLVAPRAQILEFEIVLSISIVATDAGNNVVSITDSRWLLFRLGTGGTNPNPFYVYPWIDGQTENPVTSSSDTIDPFFGGDKQLLDLKDWMNAIMSSLLEIKGLTYWYSGSSSGPNPNPGSLTKLREDALNMITVGQGTVTHGILPNNDAVLITTGTLTGGGPGGGSLALASAGNFAIGAYAAITGSTGSGSIVNGNMFITPNNMSSITNFGPSVDNGTIHFAADSVAVQAMIDATAAFTAGQILGLAGTTIPAELGGHTYGPGAYQFTGGAAFISATTGHSTLTLNGAGTYIFYAASTLITGASGSTDIPTFAFIGGATPTNTFVYWIVGSAATINQSAASAGATFYGTVIASAAITAVQAGTINGRLISLTASVTLSDTNIVNIPAGGGSNTITGMASTTGLVIGQFIFGTGIPAGTTITAIDIGLGTVTMSRTVTINAAGETISFYNPVVVTSPGQINWSDPIYLKVIGSAVSYKINANPTSADIVLADDQVAYIILGRDLLVNPNLLYTYNSIPNTTTVVSVGAVVWTASLVSGDFIRAASDPDSNYAMIQSVDSGTQVTLIGNYVPASENPAGVPSVYGFGSYNAVATPSGPRDIYITSRETVPVGQNTFWLFAREDVGGPIPTVYVHFLGQELEYGDTVRIDSGIPLEFLQYTGSPSESVSKPNYTSALIFGSIPQITSITTGPADGSGITKLMSAWPPLQAYIVVSDVIGLSIGMTVTDVTIPSNILPGTTIVNIIGTSVYISSPTQGNGFLGDTCSFGSGAGMTSDQYFLIYSSTPGRFYYVWVNKDGTGVDPNPNAAATPIEWVVSTGPTAAQTAASLASALNSTLFNDFRAVAAGDVVTVMNNSAGTATAASNVNVSAPFTISTTQTGIGIGNAIIQNGDSLTLAIKKLDAEFGLILANANNPDYDEPLSVISGAAANSNQIHGPISSGALLTLPLNSREAETAQVYIVGRGALQLFLNGQYLNLNEFVTSSIVASNSIGSGITGPNLHSPDNAFAVQVTPGANAMVTQIKFLVDVIGSLPAGNVFANIYSDSPGTPGGILATSTVIAQSTFSGTNQLVTFVFAIPFPVIAGTTYWFGIAGDSTYLTSTQHLAPRHSSSSFLTKDFFSSSSWIAYSPGPSLCFEIDANTNSGFDWTEVGSANTFSNQIQINRDLVVGDVLTFRIESGGGATMGAAGPAGPPGPAGAPGTGPGGPAAISTKVTNYTVLTGDCILKADCSSGTVTFTLPSAASMAGRIFYFTKVDTTGNAMIVQALGVDTINGLNSQATSIQYDGFMIVSDGSTWSML